MSNLLRHSVITYVPSFFCFFGLTNTSSSLELNRSSVSETIEDIKVKYFEGFFHSGEMFHSCSQQTSCNKNIVFYLLSNRCYHVLLNYFFWTILHTTILKSKLIAKFSSHGTQKWVQFITIFRLKVQINKGWHKKAT